MRGDMVSDLNDLMKMEGRGDSCIASKLCNVQVMI